MVIFNIVFCRNLAAIMFVLSIIEPKILKREFQTRKVEKVKK